MADQAGEFEMFSAYEAEDLIDQYDEFSFYNQQKDYSFESNEIAKLRDSLLTTI